MENTKNRYKCVVYLLTDMGHSFVHTGSLIEAIDKCKVFANDIYGGTNVNVYMSIYAKKIKVADELIRRKS